MNHDITEEKLAQFLDINQHILTPAERDIISAISEQIVLHDRLQGGVALIGQVVAENTALSEPRHCIIIGDAGCGKTTMLDILKSQMPQEEEVFRLGVRMNIPLLALSLPSHITPRSLAQQALRAVGITSGLNGTCFELTEQLCRYIKECNVKIVLLDELHHLLGLGRRTPKGTNARLLAARNWIKSVINETQATFILMGMPEAHALVEDGDQLARRFTHLYNMDPFGVPSSQDTNLIDFVRELISNLVDLPYFDKVEIPAYTSDDAIRLFAATGGIPSRIKDLATAAALAAFRQNSRCITMEHFAQGFEVLHRPRQQMEAGDRLRANRKILLQAIDRRELNPMVANDQVIHQLVMQMAA